MDLFNVFQSVLSFIAPPMAAVFLMGVFWKRCTTRAANLILTMVIVSLMGRDGQHASMQQVRSHVTPGTLLAWLLLAATMIGMYLFFN